MKILVINGPNLNMLGKRESSLYGVKSLADIEALIEEKARDLDVDIETFQSNSEGAIIDYLQEAASDAEGIVVNAGALTNSGR